MIGLLAIAVFAHYRYGVEVDLDNNGTIEGIETLLGQVIILAGVVTALAVLTKVALGARQKSRAIDMFFSDWYGEPERDGVPEKQGVMHRLRGLEQGQADIKHELSRNGGSSTKDAAHDARRIAREIQQQMELNAAATTKFQNRYNHDQAMTRHEWLTVFSAVREMIHLPPEEQLALWDTITEQYKEATDEFYKTHPVNESSRPIEESSG